MPGRPLLKLASRAAAWLVLPILALAAVVAVFSGSGDNAKQTQDSVEVIVGDIEENVTAQGKLEPKEYVDVGAQVTGQLHRLYVDIGDNVRAGQLLAEIDPRVYAARVQADEANIKNLKAQLAGQQAQVIFARQQFERNRELIAGDGVSLQDYQNSEFNLKNALATAQAIEAQIEQVQSTLNGDLTNLGFTKIFAPMDGTVVSRTARLGQTLNANQTTPLIMQLAKLDAMTVRAQVAEADVMRLRPDMAVYFTTLGAGERRWYGKIRQILPSPEIVNNVVLYNVLVDVDNKDRQLMSGMSTQMFFLLASVRQATLIPLSALGQRVPEADRQGGKAYRIKRLTAQGAEEKIVHIGLRNRRYAQVLEGVQAGDQLSVWSLPGQKRNGKKTSDAFALPGAARL
ncbi:efflux RND transporter periplasmic adaptor subunit [Methylomonas rhizoryzae]|uniref:efflux RND transporter periplasmic adaptor subunit n=1 Tax=Methylomonas rhizoryzae TaxID=2608981 RepID=UPI001232309A|nr:efflux RND transporter periplasmic adaptor subunit [Methylomonas rhizoryzae]